MGNRLESDASEQTGKFAAALAHLLRAGDAIVLSGPMGAGKTFFVQALVKTLVPSAPVRSPTFNLVNNYKGPEFAIYHGDFYRIEDEAELWAAGWEDYLDPSALLLVEWGERFSQALPLDYLQIRLLPLGPRRREIRVSAHGPRSEELKKEWLHALAGH